MTADQITAIASAIVAVLGAVTAFIVALRPIRKELEKNTKVTEETHVLVNSKHDALVDQQTKAENRLRENGIPLPYNPAVQTQVLGTEEPITPNAEQRRIERGGYNPTGTEEP